MSNRLDMMMDRGNIISPQAIHEESSNEKAKKSSTLVKRTKAKKDDTKIIIIPSLIIGSRTVPNAMLKSVHKI